MAPQAVFSRPGHFGSVEWEFEGRSLQIRAQGLPVESYSLRDITSIAGDDYTIHLGYAGDTLTLSRLGAEGADLREGLLLEWPVIRADALWITGEGEPRRYSGMYTVAEEEPVPFESLLYQDVLIIAPAGSDVQPLYFSSIAALSYDRANGIIDYRTWNRNVGIFSRMGRATDEFGAALDDARAQLEAESRALVAAVLPTLPASAHSVLATRWLSGEMLPMAALEAGSPGLDAALRAGWIATRPRAAEAATLLRWSDPHRLFVGYQRRPAAIDSPLWLLAGKGDSWILENLSDEDRGTFHFQGGAEVPALISTLLKAERIVDSALYLPLEEPNGARSTLAAPATCLTFLRELRQRFVELIGHDDPDSWTERVANAG